MGIFAGAAFMTHGDSFTGNASFFLGQGADRPVEPALLYLVIAVAFALIGSGRFGVDRYLRKA